MTTHDSEAANYINNIEHAWNAIQTKIDKAPMAKTEWTYAGMRPANFPERRIAAMANILSECPSYGIFRHILSAFEKLFPANKQEIEDYREDNKTVEMLIENIQSLFLDIQDSFWSYHYTFDGKNLGNHKNYLERRGSPISLLTSLFPACLSMPEDTTTLN